MNEFRLDLESVSFSLISKPTEGCKVCRNKEPEIASIPFKSGMIKVYEIKDDVQPSKFELRGDLFKSSVADGYEEILVDSQKHGDAFRGYSKEDMEKLFEIISDRVKSLKSYELGENLIVTRYLKGHGAFDLNLLHIPTKEGDKCIECEYIKQTSDREIYSDENVIAYVPFAPKNEIDITISPKKHISIDEVDPIVLFDITGLLKRLVDIVNEKSTLVILQKADGHFKLKLYGGDVSQFDVLDIKKLVNSPENVAKGLKEKLEYENKKQE